MTALGAAGAHDHGNLQRTTPAARPGRAARPPQRGPMATPGAPGAHDHGNLQRTTSPARPGYAARPPQRRPRVTLGAPGAHDHGSLWRAVTPGAAGWVARPCPASPRGGLVGSTGLCGCTAACCGGARQAAAPGKPGQRRRKRRGGGACSRPASLPWGAGLERRAYSSAALTAAGSARACTWRIRRTVLPPRMALIWRSS